MVIVTPTLRESIARSIVAAIKRHRALIASRAYIPGRRPSLSLQQVRLLSISLGLSEALPDYLVLPSAQLSTFIYQTDFLPLFAL